MKTNKTTTIAMEFIKIAGKTYTVALTGELWQAPFTITLSHNAPFGGQIIDKRIAFDSYDRATYVFDMFVTQYMWDTPVLG